MDFVNLDDINKTSFCIPFASENDEDDLCPHTLPQSLFPERDLEEGSELRFHAYRAAWKKCLDRIQGIVYNLQKSTVDAVAEEVKSSYMAFLPGLPHRELPVISVINPSCGSLLMDRITGNLEEGNDMDDSFLVVNLQSDDFPTLSTGMKSIVCSFIDKADESLRVKRKSTTSLASYDIKSLEAWYKFIMASSEIETPSSLVIVLHDFEQCDPFVMQNVFSVCSSSSLPLVFLLSMSSPLPNYLNITYPLSTISLLRVRTITAPFGIHVLQEIWIKTFFDLEFDPDVVVGPNVLEYLLDYFTRHNSSVDAILTILQLVHFKHFASDPLTTLVYEVPSSTLTRSEASPFIDSLRTRLAYSAVIHEGPDLDVTEYQSSAAIITAVDKAREEFHRRARDMRLGFGIMMVIQSELKKYGHKGLNWLPDVDKNGGLCGALLSALRGRLARDIKELGIRAKKFNTPELKSVLDSLNNHFFHLPSHVRMKEQEARSQLILLRSQIPESVDDGFESLGEIASSLSDWLKDFLHHKLRLLEEAELWDIWYTGQTPPPSELVNPSVKASVIAGLLRPHEYSAAFSEKLTCGSSEKALWELPDTSILFKRYLDSGRMINVFDWFESFKTVLDTRRLHFPEGEGATTGSSPRKKGKGKSYKRKQKEKAMTEEEEEEWRVEVQARFIRALHELDYLGFLKHTGRKADHVLRTAFEVDDDDDHHGE